MMDDKERTRRCDAVPIRYYPDKVGFMCRVYGRWVRDCFDCAYKVDDHHTGVNDD